MSPAALGATIGALAGIGLLLVTWRLAARRIRFDDRIGPYLRAPRSASALLRGPEIQTPFPTLERLVAPVMADGVRLVTRLGSPSADLRRRLIRAGRPESVEQFRAAQVVWGFLGLAAGLAVALVFLASRGSSLLVLTALVLLSGLGGVIGRDQLLSRQVREREARMLAELPTIAELLALSVGAGEGPVGALERVARTTHGDLADELARTLADARAGTPLTQALRALATRTGLAPLTRFTEGVAIAVERGTPLAEVLRAQAQDVRESGRQALMEAGGRKEVAMMVPVVFLILPITVAFAVFPSLVVLRLGQ